MIRIILLLSTLAFAQAAIPACNGTVVFNPPTNASESTWYPSLFDKSNAPVFPDNYICEYQINVPQGWFVTIEQTVKMTNPGNSDVPVNVIDQLGESENVTQALQELFFFVAPGGKVQLSTGKSGVQFGFKLTWQQFPTSDPVLINVAVADLRSNLLIDFQNLANRVTAETRVSATITPPYYDKERQFFRGIVFFDGSSGNSKCLGTGLQLTDSKTQFVSSGKNMTIWNLAYLNENTITVLLQDYENTKDIKEYRGLLFTPDVSMSAVSLSINPSNGPIALYSCDYDDADVITSITGTGTVDVYQGGVTKSKGNLLASYTAGNKNLPQAIFSTLRTYVISGGPVTMNITQDISAFQYTKPGRKVLFVSGDYGVSSDDGQATELEFLPPTVNDDGKNVSSNDIANLFRYTIQSADIKPGVTLELWFYNDGGDTVLTYNSSSLPPLNKTVEMSGNIMNVIYTSKEKNLGFYMTFETLKSVSCKLSAFSVLVFMGIFMLN